MNFEQCCQYLASKPQAQLSFPFDQHVHVYKVCDKMFALISPTSMSMNGNPTRAAQMNLKCDPYHAQELRDVFDAITPGYHMNKKHWNTLVLDGSLPGSEITRLIDHSYALVASKLTRAQKRPLELQFPETELYKGLKPFE